MQNKKASTISLEKIIKWVIGILVLFGIFGFLFGTHIVDYFRILPTYNVSQDEQIAMREGCIRVAVIGEKDVKVWGVWNEVFMCDNSALGCDEKTGRKIGLVVAYKESPKKILTSKKEKIGILGERFNVDDKYIDNPDLIKNFVEEKDLVLLDDALLFGKKILCKTESQINRLTNLRISAVARGAKGFVSNGEIYIVEDNLNNEEFASGFFINNENKIYVKELNTERLIFIGELGSDGKIVFNYDTNLERQLNKDGMVDRSQWISLVHIGSGQFKDRANDLKNYYLRGGFVLENAQ